MNTLINWLSTHQFIVTKIAAEAIAGLGLFALWRSYRRELLDQGANPTILGFLGLSD